MEKKHMGLFDKILHNIIKGRAQKTLKMVQDDPILKKKANSKNLMNLIPLKIREKRTNFQ